MKKKMNIIGYFTTPIKVVEGEMSCMQDISSYALDVKDLLNEKVSPELSDKLNEMLLGFNEDVQLEMVENMLSFICANVLHTTGCYSVDTALEMCYKWIGDEKGIATKGFGKLINRLI
ncbi:MAG: hypothetical protein II453_20800 [Alphaproteobacteria bacterium]|jgi:hypothetical protein|uniref:Uncharacterized protein n=1 Tax=Xylanibacter ruminicola TaxID=839 RepID=A0A928BU81_XYLRU|nr:hypothetical protein [Xylanibacter ruminicola]MBQ2177380.1 hypothetical protein [Alphaproteobacteria bacterium]